jgi:hypothetical protein
MECSVDECGVTSDRHKPSIQHNMPISKGGKHELGNISVICHHCNVTLQDTITDKLNADEVIKKWDEICATDKCLSNDGQVTDTCQRRLGKVSLGEYRVVESSGLATDSDSDSLENSLENSRKELRFMGGIGKGVVLLSEEQSDNLLDKLGFDAYNHYVEKLAYFIINNDAKIGNHYQTILKWAAQDAKI